MAQLVSQRPFSGYWEYHIDGALFTSPPRARPQRRRRCSTAAASCWASARLFVADAAGRDQPRTAGQHVRAGRPAQADPGRAARTRQLARQHARLARAELRRAGRRGARAARQRRQPGRGGRPAGRRPHRRHRRPPVGRLAQLWKTLWAGGAPERAVRLDIVRDGKPQTLVLQAVDRAKTMQPGRRASEARAPRSAAGQQAFGDGRVAQAQAQLALQALRCRAGAIRS